MTGIFTVLKNEKNAMEILLQNSPKGAFIVIRYKVCRMSSTHELIWLYLTNTYKHRDYYLQYLIHKLTYPFDVSFGNFLLLNDT